LATGRLEQRMVRVGRARRWRPQVGIDEGPVLGRFFERKGFVVLERQDKILRDMPIHTYRMAKTLG
jgi:hypothetical protein